MNRVILLWISTLLLVVLRCHGRKHHLVVENDFRRYFPVSTFAYFSGGQLDVQVNRIKFHPSDFDLDTTSNQIGFSLTQSHTNNVSPYVEGRYSQERCILNQDVDYFGELGHVGLVMFKFDFKNNRVTLQCNSKLSKLTIFSDHMPAKRDSVSQTNSSHVQPLMPKAASIEEEKPKSEQKNNKTSSNNNEVPEASKEKNEEKTNKLKEEAAEANDVNLNSNELGGLVDQPPLVKSNCELASFEMKRTSKSLPIDGDHQEHEFSFKFQIFIEDSRFEGLYALYFHNCLNYPAKVNELHRLSTIDLDLQIVERNLRNYLSAGEIPLPQLYFALSVIFFILGAIWFVSLQNKAQDTFKIHYLMGVLVLVKAFSLLFHGINYYFIAKEGSQVETWAILYYITHFLKGALLFVTIVLIGTGWAFIKGILSGKDKKIFVIVIPLQVLANIADIITEESEEGALIHTLWREVFILVDMVCCGAILFPVIWSIRHLQEASATDGKAAINLRKLKLFRYFYVMIVVYIYFTRIIVYVVKIAVPFNYEWLEAFFQHGATLVFFVLTGYHFQPTTGNPYYQLLQEEIEMDEEILFIQPSTFSEAKKRNRDLESGDRNDMQGLIGRPGTSTDYD